jgi:hypothetical protein
MPADLPPLAAGVLDHINAFGRNPEPVSTMDAWSAGEDIWSARAAIPCALARTVSGPCPAAPRTPAGAATG